MANIFDAHKFSPSEIFSNNNGKTSSTKIVGFITSIVCLLLFVSLVIYYLCNPLECANILEFVDRTITYFTVAAGLMGIKSVTSAFGKLTVTMEGLQEVSTVQQTTEQTATYSTLSVLQVPVQPVVETTLTTTTSLLTTTLAEQPVVTL